MDLHEHVLILMSTRQTSSRTFRMRLKHAFTSPFFRNPQTKTIVLLRSGEESISTLSERLSWHLQFVPPSCGIGLRFLNTQFAEEQILATQPTRGPAVSKRMGLETEQSCIRQRISIV